VATSKILVIDDSRVIRKTVRDMLPDGDFEVIEAKDGVEGINLIGKEHPSLIMLDFILPKMSGWEVFQQIQAHPQLQKIPLVLMSGKKEEVTSKISEPFEYFEFIEKPFDRVILAEAIRVAMTKARKVRPHNPDLVGSLPPALDGGQVSNEAIAQLQAQIAQLQAQPAQVNNEVVTQLQAQLAQSHEQISQLQAQAIESQERVMDLQKVTGADIQALQAQLAGFDRSKQTEIQELITKFAEFEQGKEAEHKVVINKVMELEGEIDTLKKQLGQLVVLIKKKLMA
jgi:CheY-like chemotaxis protein